MLIDCFPGFNEFELAEFRIEYLSELVDLVIIAESSLTHSGDSKDLYFAEWLDSKPILKNRVRVIEVHLSAASTHWEREITTRETLIKYAAKEFPNGKFILSDLDEIPSRKQVESFLKSNGCFHYITPSTYRFANWHLLDGHSSWKLGVMGDASIADLPNGGRKEKLAVLKAPDEGLHFSYLRHDAAKLEFKLRSFAHQELNFPEMYSPSTLQFADFYQIDHLGRFQRRGKGLLKTQSKNELSAIQAEALKFEPSWFNFNSPLVSTSQRKFASLIITTIAMNKRHAGILFTKFILGNNKSFLNSSIAYLLLVKTWWGSYLAQIKQIIRKLIWKRF